MDEKQSKAGHAVYHTRSKTPQALVDAAHAMQDGC